MSKEKKCDKFYVDGEGEKSRHASIESKVLSFEFADGTVQVIDPFQYPDDIQHILMFNGAAQKLGDSYAGSKDIAEAIEKFLTVHENLGENNWITRAEGAVRTTILAQALVRTLPAKYPDVESAQARIKEYSKEQREGLLNKDTGHKALIANYEMIKAENAKERADKALQDATSEDVADDDSQL